MVTSLSRRIFMSPCFRPIIQVRVSMYVPSEKLMKPSWIQVMVTGSSCWFICTDIPILGFMNVLSQILKILSRKILVGRAGLEPTSVANTRHIGSVNYTLVLSLLNYPSPEFGRASENWTLVWSLKNFRANHCTNAPWWKRWDLNSLTPQGGPVLQTGATNHIRLSSNLNIFIVL